MVAGRRFGKTLLAITELLVDALSKPKQYLWYVAPTFRQAKMIAWKLIKQTEPKGAQYNESELSVTFPNGSIIELKGADNENSLRGIGLNGLVVDEFASIYDNWSVWHEVLRPALTDKKGWVLFIGTPKGKDSFFDLWMRGQRNESGWKSWKFTTIDNPYIDPKEVKEARQEMPERYFKQEYEASFEDYAGLIYPEFSEKIHIIKPFDIPKEWESIGGIDPAISGTTAALFARIDTHDNIYITGEYYERDKRVSEVSEAIRGKSSRWIIDPASKQKNQVKDGNLYSLFDEYSDYGIYPSTAENDVPAGINRVGEYFKTNKIKIFSTCVNLIYELQRYHWAEQKETSKGITQPTPFKSNDHAVDTLRYIIMSRPNKTYIKQAEPPRNSIAAFIQEDREASWNNDWREKYARN